MVPRHSGSPGFQSECASTLRPSANTIATPIIRGSISSSTRRIAHRDHPLELEAHLLGLAQLPGNMPLSQVERMVDHRRGHDQTPLGLALGDKRMESVGKFLGDEAGREPSLAPARMLHQRRQKRDVVPDAVDDEGVERGRLRVDRAEPVGRVGDELGDHRIVVDRDLPALEHAGVVAHRDAVMRPFGRRTIAA